MNFVHFCAIAAKYAHADNFLFIGRKYNYPMALEGALKLKEISYIHAEGCAAGEMKHGFIALIDENFPSVCLATRDTTYVKTVSNMQEFKSRNGRIIAIATEVRLRHRRHRRRGHLHPRYPRLPATHTRRRRPAAPGLLLRHGTRLRDRPAAQLGKVGDGGVKGGGFASVDAMPQCDLLTRCSE